MTEAVNVLLMIEAESRADEKSRKHACVPVELLSVHLLPRVTFVTLLWELSLCELCCTATDPLTHRCSGEVFFSES